MRSRKIKVGRAYSNGKRVRIVDYVESPSGYGMVDFHEASDGLNSSILSTSLEEFAEWATHEVKANWVKV